MKKKYLLLTIMFFLFQFTIYAQDNITVSGTVTDNQGQPLPGTSVVLKGTTTGSQTDFDGNFTLDNIPENGVLVFSYVGFTTQEIPIGSQNSINITLLEDAQALDEVVVVGYGTQKKEDITGSIAVIKGDDVSRQPNANALSSVQGRVAGVNITNSGRAGEAPTIRIRGVGSVSNADPLFVVDGVLTNDISYLNPADIESLNILKDASSSAIYGIRAANGVIVITTKKGKRGQESMSITYDAFAGVQRVSNVPELANASQYIQLFNEKQIFEGSDLRLNPADFNADTDWFDEILRDSPLIHSNNFTVTGSSKNIRYSFGAGYFGQEGLLDAGNNVNSGDNFRRITGRLALDIDLSKYVTVGGSIAYTDTENNIANEPFFQAYIAPPIFPVFNPDGSFGAPEAVGNFANPRATLDLFRSKAQGNRILSNVYVEIKPIESLKLRSSFSGDYSTARSFQFTPEFNVSVSQQSPVSTLAQIFDENDNWLWENTLTWQKSFKKHDLTLLAGFSQEERISFGLSGFTNEVDFIDDDSSLFLDLGNVDTERTDDRGSTTRFQSVFFRFQYKYDNKYLLNATLRNDQASQFADQNNSEIFPSVGAGWIISNESFMQNSAFNNLKLKASYGELGNANVPRGFDVTATTPGITFFGDPAQAVVARSISVFSDPSIFFESVTEYDVGAEFAVLQNRLSGEVNYYNRTTNDAVFNVTQLASSGATNTQLLTNAGSFRNSGVEVTLNWADQITDDLSLNLYGNITTVSNEITEVLGASFLNTGPALFGNSIVRLEEGAEIGSYFGFVTEGVVQTQEQADELGSTVGAFIFEDRNNDGVIGEDDKTFLGSPIPDFTYGFGFSLGYKNFDLGIDFQGVAGNEIYNFNREARFGNENFDLFFFENRFTPGSGVMDFPAPNSDQTSSRPSDFYVEKGDFFRIRNIQLGYLLPKISVGDTQLWESFRIFLNAQNPVTFFSYSGFSPEVNGGGGANPPGGSVVNAGIDNNIFPLSATYNLGVSIKF